MILFSEAVFYKKAVLKNYTIFIIKQLCWSLFLIKLQTGLLYCDFFKNTYFEEYLRMAAFVLQNLK